MKPVALYIHVPFCIKKCPYCIFYKEDYSLESEQAFINALDKEAEFYQKKFPSMTIKTVFIGGGTPNILSLDSLKKLCHIINSRFQLQQNAEFTVEINPDHVTKTKMSLLFKNGVNRISIGSQSFNQSDLNFLGRTHSPDKTKKTVQLLKEIGFENIKIGRAHV